jgi:hypothetical protein
MEDVLYTVLEFLEKYEGYDLTNPYEVKKLDAIGNENS